MNFGQEFDNASSGIFAARALDRNTLGEAAFHRMISMERRRTTRSRKSFMLMLLDMGEHSSKNRLGLQKVLSTLSLVLRETDVTGWYKEGSIVGVMFTEITLEDQNAIPATLMTRVSQTLKSHLPPRQFHQLSLSFHLLPEAPDQEVDSPSDYSSVYPGVAANGAAGSSL